MRHGRPRMASRWLLSVAAVLAAAAGGSQPVRFAALAQNATRASTHASWGVVKAVSATSLVVAPRRRLGERTFVLTPSTVRQGQLTVGATVSVRYWRDGSTLVATAVSAHPVRNLALTPGGDR